MSGQLNSIITRSLSVTFMTMQLFQFRFADTEGYSLGFPPTLINWWPSWLIALMSFWTSEETVPVVPVRDIFPGEYKVLREISTSWRLPSSCCFGWEKLALAKLCSVWYVGSTASHRCFQQRQLGNSGQVSSDAAGHDRPRRWAP